MPETGLAFQVRRLPQPSTTGNTRSNLRQIKEFRPDTRKSTLIKVNGYDSRMTAKLSQFRKLPNDAPTNRMLGVDGSAEAALDITQGKKVRITGLPQTIEEIQKGIESLQKRFGLNPEIIALLEKRAEKAPEQGLADLLNITRTGVKTAETIKKVLDDADNEVPIQITPQAAAAQFRGNAAKRNADYLEKMPFLKRRTIRIKIDGVYHDIIKREDYKIFKKQIREFLTTTGLHASGVIVNDHSGAVLPLMKDGEKVGTLETYLTRENRTPRYLLSLTYYTIFNEDKVTDAMDAMGKSGEIKSANDLIPIEHRVDSDDDEKEDEKKEEKEDEKEEVVDEL